MLLSSSHCLYIEFKYMPRDLVYCPCGSVSYTRLLFRCASPVCMYSVVSMTTTHEPLSACLMVKF